MNSGEGDPANNLPASESTQPEEDDGSGTVNVSARLRANDPALMNQLPPTTSYLQGLVKAAGHQPQQGTPGAAVQAPGQVPQGYPPDAPPGQVASGHQVASAQQVVNQSIGTQPGAQPPPQPQEFAQPPATQSLGLDRSVWTESGELLPGAVIAEKYEVISLIGKGGMSSVYKIRHSQLDTVLALKLLDKSLWTDPDAVKRFKLEAQTIGRLTHPNLITYRDFGITAGGQPYLVMDYVDGSTLSDRIKPNQGMFLPTCIEIFQQLAEGLKIAHDQGIVHRDIKPGNIMFVAEGSDQLKLVDFGLAKIVTEDGNQGLTRTGDVFGSPLYMSPEQCLGKKVDHRSDIYSIGCVIYEAMTGKLPLKGNTILETMNNHVEKMHPKMTDIDPGLIAAQRASWVNVEDLQYIVLRCLQKRPNDRYDSIDALLADLINLKKQAPVEKRDLTTGTIKRLRDSGPSERTSPMQMLQMLGAVAFVVVGIGITGLAGWYFLQPKQPSTSIAKVEEKHQKVGDNPLFDGSVDMEDAVDTDGKARSYMEKGKFEQARDLWKFSVTTYKGKGNADAMLADAYIQQGVCDFQLKNYQEALECYSQAIAVYDKKPEFYTLQRSDCMTKQAEVKRALNDIDGAEKLEKEAVELREKQGVE